jgi:hypothetical protein
MPFCPHCNRNTFEILAVDVSNGGQRRIGFVLQFSAVTLYVFFFCCRFRSRTPGPPPFSSMNVI